MATPFYCDTVLARTRRLIGLSLNRAGDAILASDVEITGNGDTVRAGLAGYTAAPLDPVMRAAIHAARRPATSPASAITVLDAALGLAYADAAVQARSSAGWKRTDVAAVGVCGATVWLQESPVELAGAFVTGVLELGDANGIAEALGVPVVSGFVARDLAAGGRGSPLEALADYLVFRDPVVNRVVRRTGPPMAGIFLPAGGSTDDVRDSAVDDGAVWQTVTPESFGWPDESYEAAVAALLADRAMQGLPGNLPHLTGAGRAVVLGSITPGR